MLNFVYSNNFFTFRVGLTFLILQYIYVVIQLMLQHTCINKIGSVQYRAAGASRSSDAAFRQHYCGHVFSQIIRADFQVVAGSNCGTVLREDGWCSRVAAYCYTRSASGLCVCPGAVVVQHGL